MEWSNEKIKTQIEEIFIHTKTMNKELGEARDEMGGIQKEVNEIKNILTSHKVAQTKNSTDIDWIKNQVGKIDNRTWIILSTIILGFVIQLVLRLLL